jgi:hypothetical protein
MSAFVLKREYALQLPNSYVDIDSDEMEYIDGGYTLWQKALVASAIVAAGVGLVVALSYGQIYLAAKIMKITFANAVKKLTIKGVATIVAGSLTISSGIVVAALSLVF